MEYVVLEQMLMEAEMQIDIGRDVYMSRDVKIGDIAFVGGEQEVARLKHRLEVMKDLELNVMNIPTGYGVKPIDMLTLEEAIKTMNLNIFKAYNKHEHYTDALKECKTLDDVLKVKWEDIRSY